MILHKFQKHQNSYSSNLLFSWCNGVNQDRVIRMIKNRGCFEYKMTEIGGLFKYIFTLFYNICRRIFTTYIKIWNFTYEKVSIFGIIRTKKCLNMEFYL